MTIGASDGPAELLFAGIVEISLGRGGSIFVVDDVLRGTNSRVLQFDSTGRFLRRVGRRGQGPGEYIGPQGIRQLPNGYIALRDNSNSRINIYRGDGSPAETWRFQRTNAPDGAKALQTDTAGFLYLWAAGGRDADSFRGLIRYGAGGTVVDSLREPRPSDGPESTRPTVAVQSRGTGVVSNMSVPFYPRPVLAWSPLGYWISGYPETYQFDIHLPGAPRRGPAIPAGGSVPRPVHQWQPGDRVLRVTRTVGRVPVSMGEREEQRRILEASGRLADPQWQWNGSEIPAVKPPYRSILAGADGRIWVQLSATAIQVDSSRAIRAAAPPGRTSPVPPQRWIERNLWDIFLPEGTYYGQVELPFGLTLHAANGDTLWAVGTNTDDVPVIHRLRITWP